MGCARSSRRSPCVSAQVYINIANTVIPPWVPAPAGVVGFSSKAGQCEKSMKFNAAARIMLEEGAHSP